MKLKFSTLATSCFFGLLAASSHAQGTAAKTGFLRFWNMLPAANGTFELRKPGGSSSEGTLLKGISFQYSSYAEFPPGTYQLSVFKTGTTTPLKTFNLNLQANAFFTIIVGPKAGAIDVEVTNDTNDPKAESGTLAIRNYFPGITVNAATDSQSLVDGLNYGQTVVRTGLPLARTPITLHSKLPDGKPVESGAEADFKAGAKRATLLIIPDPYGRFRPRVTIDGKE